MKRKIIVVAISFLLSGVLLTVNTEISSGFQTLNLEEIVTLNLEKGDITFRNIDEELYPLFKYFLHSMMYTGNTRIDKNGYIEYEFIEANGGRGVIYRYYTKEEILNPEDGLHRYSYRVKDITSEQVDNAVDFAITQLGQPFLEIIKQYKNYNPEDENDPHSDEWYCTEIVWAAYYNCFNEFPNQEPEEGYTYGEGIDIDANGGYHVLPADIMYSRNTERINLYVVKETEEENHQETIKDPAYTVIDLEVINTGEEAEPAPLPPDDNPLPPENGNPLPPENDGDEILPLPPEDTEYTLTVIVQTGDDTGTVAIYPDTDEDKYASGTPVTLTANPAQGFAFDHWSGSEGNIDDNPLTVMMDSNKTIYAHFGLDWPMP